jgi:hypothetical protein
MHAIYNQTLQRCVQLEGDLDLLGHEVEQLRQELKAKQS